MSTVSLSQPITFGRRLRKEVLIFAIAGAVALMLSGALPQSCPNTTNYAPLPPTMSGMN